MIWQYSDRTESLRRSAGLPFRGERSTVTRAAVGARVFRSMHLRGLVIITIFVVAILFTSPRLSAGPIDFLKRVGHSIDRANRRAQAAHRTAERRARKAATNEATQRSYDTNQPQEFAPTRGSQPGAQRVAERKHPSGASASSAPAKVALADLPYGVPVPNRPGFVVSPYSPGGGYVDIQGYPSGSPVKDPYTGKIFRVP